MTFDRICRLCLRQTPGLSSLFADNGAQMFEKLTSIKINQNDLCLQVCFQCLCSLKLAYNIQQDLIQSDGRFRELLKYSQDELNDLIKIETKNFVSLPSTGKEDCCLICGEFVSNLSSNGVVEKHFEDITLCDNCRSQTVTSFVDNKPVADLQQSNSPYKCEKCDHTFLYKAVLEVHMRNTHAEIDDRMKTRSPSLSTYVGEVKDSELKIEAPNKTIDDILKSDDDNFGGFSPLSESRHSFSDFTPAEEDDDDDEEEVKRKPAPARTKTKTESESPTQKHAAKKKVKRPLPRNFSCDECKKTFTSQKRLDKHVHPKKRILKKKPCPYCKREYDTSNYNRHVAKHTSEPQICDLCGAIFKNKDGLRTHMFYSHSAYRYKCNQCDKVFQKQLKRDLHIKRDHEDNPEFMCDTCGKKFYARDNLNAHIKRIHLKLRPYVCDICLKDFSSRGAKNFHKKQHTIELPYKCDLCGEGFKQKVSLRTHKESKHNIVEEITVLCKKCGKGFSSDRGLLSHKRATCFI